MTDRDEPTNEAFLLSEYSILNERFQRQIQQVVQDQRFAISATFIFWAWLATHEIDLQLLFIKWLPLAFVVFFYVKWVVFEVAIKRQLEYMKSVEDKVGIPTRFGWIRNQKRYGRDLLGPFSHAYWGVLLLVNLFFALILRDGPALTPAG